MIEIIPQNMTKNVDSLGRITIPVGLRKRMKIFNSEKVEIFTILVDGKEMIGIAQEELGITDYLNGNTDKREDDIQ